MAEIAFSDLKLGKYDTATTETAGSYGTISTAIYLVVKKDAEAAILATAGGKVQHVRLDDGFKFTVSDVTAYGKRKWKWDDEATKMGWTRVLLKL